MQLNLKIKNNIILLKSLLLLLFFEAGNQFGMLKITSSDPKKVAFLFEN
jgi:hypothetical protein